MVSVLKIQLVISVFKTDYKLIVPTRGKNYLGGFQSWFQQKKVNLE